MRHDHSNPSNTTEASTMATVAETTGTGGEAAEPATIRCGCAMPAADGARRAVAVDPDAKERNLKRLRRIEGQVRGLQKMVDDDRYCADILTQISSVHEALRAVGRELMRNHLKHCATSAIAAGPEEASDMYDELVELIYKHSR
jgi:DNA-binding FrmR family transcriptional regulator